jgi:hypothetical protein
MFYLIKGGRLPNKTSLISLAVALNLNIHDIDSLLPKAGYVLSRSIAYDMVLRWLIEHDNHKSNRIMHINHVLNELELPLLMTRAKN